MISENCFVFIVLNYKKIQTIIAMITESKVIEFIWNNGIKGTKMR